MTRMFYEEEQEVEELAEVIACSRCSEVGTFMGRIGSVKWFQCRECGFKYEENTNAERLDESPLEERMDDDPKTNHWSGRDHIGFVESY